MNTWWVRNLVCLSADQRAENHLENSGVVARRVTHVARRGIFVWNWALEYQHRWNHQDRRRFHQCLHLHVRYDPGPGKSHTRDRRTFQDAWGESRRTAPAEEVKRGDEVDQDTRPLDPSSSSTGPDPKRLKPITTTDVENLAHRMDEETSLRNPASFASFGS